MNTPFEALKRDGRHEFFGNDNPRCPHCATDYSIPDNDAWHLFDDNNQHEIECPSCKQEFRVISTSTWTFSTDEQDEIEP